MISQTKEILLRLQKGEKLTTIDGLRLKNKTMNLRSRISNIRDMGYDVDFEWAKTKSGKRVKRYFLKP